MKGWARGNVISSVLKWAGQVKVASQCCHNNCSGLLYENWTIEFSYLQRNIRLSMIIVYIFLFLWIFAVTPLILCSACGWFLELSSLWQIVHNSLINLSWHRRRPFSTLSPCQSPANQSHHLHPPSLYIPANYSLSLNHQLPFHLFTIYLWWLISTFSKSFRCGRKPGHPTETHMVKNRT